MNKVELGRKGEDIAADYLMAKGMEIIVRNYRCAIGEIDIVGLDKDYIVFVEVRAKQSSRFGTPAESINSRKKSKVRRVAQYYLTQFPDASKRQARFDFVGVVFDKDNPPRVEHLEGVY